MTDRQERYLKAAFAIVRDTPFEAFNMREASPAAGFNQVDGAAIFQTLIDDRYLRGGAGGIAHFTPKGWEYVRNLEEQQRPAANPIVPPPEKPSILAPTLSHIPEILKQANEDMLAQIQKPNSLQHLKDVLNSPVEQIKAASFDALREQTQNVTNADLLRQFVEKDDELLRRADPRLQHGMWESTQSSPAPPPMPAPMPVHVVNASDFHPKKKTLLAVIGGVIFAILVIVLKDSLLKPITKRLGNETDQVIDRLVPSTQPNVTADKVTSH